MSDKLYNFLKYFVAIVMPAMLVLFKVIAGECDLSTVPVFSTNVAEFVTNIWVALEAFLGAVFCIGNATYYAKHKDGKVTIEGEEEINE